jgi:hypothetical protein
MKNSGLRITNMKFSRNQIIGSLLLLGLIMLIALAKFFL